MLLLIQNIPRHLNSVEKKEIEYIFVSIETMDKFSFSL